MSVGGRCGEPNDLALVLATARSEIFQLAIAIALMDEHGTAVASARLRWALCVAEQIAHSRVSSARVEVTQFETVRAHANRWLSISPRELTLPALQHVVTRDAERRARGEPRINATNANLTGLVLDGLSLSVCLRNTSLTDITGRHVLLDNTDATAATFRACRLYGCSMERATLHNARFDECDLSNASLNRSSWRRSVASHCTLLDTSLRDTSFKEATFVECDLRWATFDITKARNRSGMRSTQFIRCDLRETSWRERDLAGVSFIECKLYGVQGNPLLNDAVIEQPDLSANADGSQRATRGDVVGMWTRPSRPRRTRVQ